MNFLWIILTFFAVLLVSFEWYHLNEQFRMYGVTRKTKILTGLMLLDILICTSIIIAVKHYV